MKKEQSDKLEGINTNDFHFIVTNVVFVTKRHLIILNFDYSMVPYCNPESVSAEIFDHIILSPDVLLENNSVRHVKDSGNIGS